MTDKTVIAADGTNLAHRAWFAQQGHATVDTVHRFVTNMLKTAATRATTERVLVAFDAPGAADWRRTLLPHYKTGRSPKPDGLTDALTALPDLLTADGLTVNITENCEADDILAQAASEYEQTACFTSDKDAFALIRDPHVAVLRPGNPLEWVTDTTLQRRYGITGTHYLLFAALCGDPSDNIDGLPGVGPKSAAKLVNAVDNLDGFRNDLENGGQALLTAVGRTRGLRLLTDAAATLTTVERNVTLMTPAKVPTLGPVPRWSTLENNPPF